MTGEMVLQAINLGGVFGFAIVVWIEIRQLRADLGKLVSRIDYAAGAADHTPPFGLKIHRSNGGRDRNGDGK